MPKFNDLVGKRFGRLLVKNHVGRTKSKKQLWECLCDCGNTHHADSGCLVAGNTMSCGCYLKERITKHGGSGRASYNSWRAMMRRCYKTEDKDYPRYGGVGVTVFAAWHEYPRFVADMGEPAEGQTLDRVDPYGDYTPYNCRWASLTTQARNIRARKNKSGHRGIYALPNGKWMAAITAQRRKFYGKCRESLAEALADRVKLERTYWGDK
jgi:hypothetical protein